MPVPIAPAPTTPTTSWDLVIPRSSSLEARLSLLEKRAHAFRVVRRSARLALQRLLVVELRREVDAERAVECPLDETEPARGLSREVARDGKRLLLQRRRLDDA